jgi:fructose-1,6-bisphosphatase/inositol monophosphatase family enzyme
MSCYAAAGLLDGCLLATMVDLSALDVVLCSVGGSINDLTGNPHFTGGRIVMLEGIGIQHDAGFDPIRQVATKPVQNG